MGVSVSALDYSNSVANLDLFAEILQSVEFHRDCNVSSGENAVEFVEAIEEILRRGGFNLDSPGEDAFQFVLEELTYEESIYIERIYKTEEPRKRF